MMGDGPFMVVFVCRIRDQTKTSVEAVFHFECERVNYVMYFPPQCSDVALTNHLVRYMESKPLYLRTAGLLEMASSKRDNLAGQCQCLYSKNIDYVPLRLKITG